MDFSFWKMHGAGNDFILLDDRAETFPARDTAWIRALCTRRTGIGSEGLLLMRPSTEADFRMLFFNPDGREADMCGNGARCIARLAHELGAAPRYMRMETGAGLIAAEVIEQEEVRLSMIPPRDWRMELSLSTEAGVYTCHSVNSGVPHAVLWVDALDAVDVPRAGRLIRRHEAFAPQGTNVNFVEQAGPNHLRIRTYERGVEAETLACGTGIVAAGLVAGRLGRATPPVRLTSAGGDMLTVDYRLTADGAEEVTLTGPTRHVYTGQVAYPGRTTP